MVRQLMSHPVQEEDDDDYADEEEGEEVGLDERNDVYTAKGPGVRESQTSVMALRPTALSATAASSAHTYNFKVVTPGSHVG